MRMQALHREFGPGGPTGMQGLFALALLGACGSKELPGEANPAKAPPPPAAVGTPSSDVASVWFEEVAAASGVDFVHTFGPQRFWIPEVTGSGVGLFDYDGDGDLDLYALQGSDLLAEAPTGPGNRLFAGNGDGTFEDVTAKAGVGDQGFGMGCAVGDYDRDGDLDLYVTNVGPNVLYRNRGDGTFENVTEASATGLSDWSTAASFVDFDGDGWLDLFVVNYLRWSPANETECLDASGNRTYCHPNRYAGPARDTLLRNRGDGTFEDVSAAKGLHTIFGNGLGLVWGQLDDMPGIDFYVANDGMANQLWSGRTSGPMEERARLAGCALSGNGQAEAGMGVCLEDLNRDGIWDLLVTHLAGETNTFYMGGRRGFKDGTGRSGTAASSRAFTGFGVGLADFDQDGWPDLYVANGRVAMGTPTYSKERPLAEPDQVFRGLPGGQFEEHSPRGGTDPEILSVSRGAAFGDLDGDGDVDVVINDNGGPLRILRNVAPKKGHWALLDVRETDGQAAVGARLEIQVGTAHILRQVQRTYSFCAQNDPRVHLGTGLATAIERVTVTWLDGTQSEFGPLPVDQISKLQRPDPK